MKEYLKMSDVFPDGVYVGTEEWMNGWFEVRHVGGSSIDESCDGGYSERDANYVAHAINSHDELVALVGDLVAAIAIAKCALEDCYDVTEYPANGSSQCDRAIAVAEMAIYKAKGA